MANLTLVLVVLAALTANCGLAQRFPTSLPWPLCGRLYLANASAVSCPQSRWGSTSFTDLPISDGYTARKKESESNRCDFHRGIDINAPIGSPVFAIESGYVYKIEQVTVNGNNDGLMLRIRHNRSNGTLCKTSVGQWLTAYMHLSSTVWNTTCSSEAACNASVTKGQKIGTVGTGYNGFAHLHFEVRDAPSYDQCSGHWQGDAIHPLRVLPYDTTTNHHTNVSIRTVTGAAAGAINVTVVVAINTTRFDFNKIEVQLRSGATGGSIVGTFQTPNTTGYGSYNVRPNWYDTELWNRQWSHKDSTTVPFSLFGLPAACGGNCSGLYACPYCEEHGCSYNSTVHLDKQCPDDASQCCFNGVRVNPAVFNNASASLNYIFTFDGLRKAALDPAITCVEARAYAAGNNTLQLAAKATWGSCGSTDGPIASATATSTAASLIGPATNGMTAGRGGGASPPPEGTTRRRKSPKEHRKLPRKSGLRVA